MALGVTHMCVRMESFVFYVTEPIPDLSFWCSGEELSWSSTFYFHISLRGHTKVWLEPGIFVSDLRPEKLFCEGCGFSCPMSFLICSAWAVKSHSIPSLSPLVQSQSSLFLYCSLAKKPTFNQAALNSFSSLLFIFHLSLFPSPSFFCPVCLSWTLDPWEYFVAALGLPARAFPWHGCPPPFPDAFSHPRQLLTFLLLLWSDVCLFALCRVWVNDLLFASSFLLQFQCSILIYSK